MKKKGSIKRKYEEKRKYEVESSRLAYSTNKWRKSRRVKDIERNIE